MLAERIVTGESISSYGTHTIHRIKSSYFDDDLGAIVEEEHDVRYEDGREISRDLIYRNISRHMQPLNILGEMRPMEFVGYNRPAYDAGITTVQEALNELNTSLSGIEWRTDGAYINGERLVSTITSDSTAFIPADINLETKVYNPEVEELKDKVANLEEEIALLKMKFMEN